jgi:hypothetical protein
MKGMKEELKPPAGGRFLASRIIRRKGRAKG